jgi:ketosteroid isomerase-like protein
MSEQENREVVDRYWRIVGAADWEDATALMHDEFVEEWPQSGERVRGASNWLSMINAHPTPPAIKAVRTWGGGDLWVTHAEFDYARDSQPMQILAVLECRDGKIAHITQVFGAPFEASEWRAEWVERG